MKYIGLLILLLNVSVACSQQLHLRGSVLDEKTHHPIADATISISSKNLFYPADNTGKFDIANNQINSSDSISFSCIGYQTQKLKVGDMQFSDTIKLSPIINMLQEVKVRGNPTPNIVVGGDSKFTGGTAGLKPGTEIAMFMAGSQNIKGDIQTVSFFLSNGHSVAEGGDATAPFRIKLYAVDTGHTPGAEII